MAPSISDVRPLEPYVVRVTFADGEVRDVDIEPLLDGPVFVPLRDPEEFAKARIEPELGVLSWPSESTFDSEGIYGIHPPAFEPSARVTTPGGEPERGFEPLA